MKRMDFGPGGQKEFGRPVGEESGRPPAWTTGHRYNEFAGFWPADNLSLWMQTLQKSLATPAWLALEQSHAARVGPYLDAHAARMRRGEAHPVYDFLFTYYSFAPAHLRRWHPGFGVLLTGAEAERFLNYRGYCRIGDGIGASVEGIRPERAAALHWMLSMLEGSQSRPARFGCYGLHEWAMVYRSSSVRHPYPLRMSAGDLAAFVEAQALCCTHYDAFRFFTPEARPLNRLQPERATTIDLEQRGCLHANMDLYKWAYKLVPLTSSRLIADCFELARAIREVDMRASPYDLADLGFPPIRIEDPAGRAEYEAAQRIFSQRAEPLRGELIALLREVVHTI
jgi:hypothetical protein